MEALPNEISSGLPELFLPNFEGMRLCWQYLNTSLRSLASGCAPSADEQNREADKRVAWRVHSRSGLSFMAQQPSLLLGGVVWESACLPKGIAEVCPGFQPFLILTAFQVIWFRPKTPAGSNEDGCLAGGRPLPFVPALLKQTH